MSGLFQPPKFWVAVWVCRIAYALATGLVCGFAAGHYPTVISPPYAAILGTLVVYPWIVVIWWRFNR